MDYFKNESETHILHELNIENRLDRVSLHGSVDITHDAAGLALACQLQAMLAGMIAVLQTEQANGALPEQISLASAAEVDNPFL
ncbi:hypothetical protein [Thiothrix fructosivorans]|jgi:hypothetical protein|uniref:Uncharacterized protein n=1 Tax=Thiothrix fructosivorans TaxID=111770 RepID=A0A8B0SRU5_9GAMM|nr:hypothetical protein [Thiothrix fructosivorans]MBO0612938.1 hypothetical protein [Thiothrix fructosivorans]QTX11612.1 hypothetical protein J1836_004465 [Thiothrix fructosivorans]